ncbi:futalosine hydrolase [Halalkalibacter alkaliphilus]|uniref:Futalosine hydrolase n=1 Tax=Halalkalibacter alkaliphilus TaxID=2917993 RepID=A0A9X2CVA2_9BACI|nr:futalosine hydrolase [Halalkalibacter alkaliphilus]MCL7748878.1 futalosine hydrolase [Halalkalibacter alkaliphilus]
MSGSNKVLNRRVLIVTSVSAEKEAILRGLRNTNDFDVIVAGVGQAAAAVATATALAKTQYNYVINAGIAGGFEGKAEVGSLAVSTEVVAADLGAESYDGFLSLEELKLGSSKIEVEQAMVTRICAEAMEQGIPVQEGAILTLSTVTGTQETANYLLERFPHAIAEGMEGFGVAEAAKQTQIPVIEVRSISNKVGPRDRESWRIKEALATLEKASSIFSEVFK